MQWLAEGSICVVGVWCYFFVMLLSSTGIVTLLFQIMLFVGGEHSAKLDVGFSFTSLFTATVCVGLCPMVSLAVGSTLLSLCLEM